MLMRGISLLRQDQGVKIICVGRNYPEHAAELGDEPPTEPLLFGKFENTVIADGEPIVLEPPLRFDLLPRALRVLVPPHPE